MISIVTNVDGTNWGNCYKRQLTRATRSTAFEGMGFRNRPC